MPMIIGPMPIPKSASPVKVPMAEPRAEPPFSMAQINSEGVRRAHPVPKIIATRMNIGRVVEQARITVAIMIVMRQGRITFLRS